MVNKKSWNEFRNSGLLWFTNTILHMFGWAIVLVENNGEIAMHIQRELNLEDLQKNLIPMDIKK